MTQLVKRFNRFWMKYSRAGQQVTKFAANPDMYIKDQLKIIEMATAELTKLRSERALIANDELVDKQIDKLKNAIDARALRVLSKANPHQKSMNETHLVRLVTKAAKGTTISRGVFRAHEVIAENTRSSTNKFNKEISSAANRGEDMKTEFKKSVSQHESISKSLVSFANSNGGNIYVGIAEFSDINTVDKAIYIADKYWAVGVFNNIDLHRQKLTAFIIKHTNLTAGDYEMRLLEFDSKFILKIIIKPIWKSNRELYFLNNEAYTRNDNATYKLSGIEVYNKTRRLANIN